jgi:hypothetical protein
MGYAARNARSARASVVPTDEMEMFIAAAISAYDNPE